MATILIVDTSQSDRRMYITLLGNFGYRLLEASDGAEALELARTELPDLIISSIIMPKLDGFTFVRRLRAEPLLAAVPVIFQTANYLEAEVSKPPNPKRSCVLCIKLLGSQPSLQDCLKPDSCSVNTFNCWPTSSTKK